MFEKIKVKGSNMHEVYKWLSDPSCKMDGMKVVHHGTFQNILLMKMVN